MQSLLRVSSAEVQSLVWLPLGWNFYFLVHHIHNISILALFLDLIDIAVIDECPPKNVRPLSGLLVPSLKRATTAAVVFGEELIENEVPMSVLIGPLMSEVIAVSVNEIKKIQSSLSLIYRINYSLEQRCVRK